MAKSKRLQDAEAAAERLAQPAGVAAPRVPPIPPEDFLSTGCALLNTALTGHPDRGVPKGTFLYLVGDSGSLKTFLAFALFAEAAGNPAFDPYRFVYDAPENGALFEIPKFFGGKAEKRITPPKADKDGPRHSDTVQGFYYSLDAALSAGPCLYVLDSMDGLNSEEDEAKFVESKRAFEVGKETTGSYGTAKAKANSANINRVTRRLRETGSILVVVSQTRDKIGGTIPGRKTRSGGRALRFYAHLELWTSVKSPLSRTYMGKKREYGSLVTVDVQKNRVCGWEGRLDVRFVKGFGVDDVGTQVAYLTEEGHWESDGERVKAPEFAFDGKSEKLIEKIQAEDREGELRALVAARWAAVRDGAQPRRKVRYT